MTEVRLIAGGPCGVLSECLTVMEAGGLVYVIGHPATLPEGAPSGVGPGEAVVTIPAALLEQAVRARQEQDRAQLDFLHQLLAATSASGADINSELLWHSDGQRIHVWANVSDVFAWGGADAEEITPENLPVLLEAIADLKAIHRFDQIYAPELFAARLRGMRPQGAAYPKERAATQALFDACGPAREPGFGNPRRVPIAEDWQQAQLDQDHADLRAQQAELRERRTT